MVTLIGEGITIDELAHHFGTIGYEVLTGLGRRHARVYKDGAAAVEPAAAASAHVVAIRFRFPGCRAIEIAALDTIR